MYLIVDNRWGGVRPPITVRSPSVIAVRPRPSAVRPRPSAVRPRPSAVRPRPSAVRPRPSAVRPRPSAVRPRPSAVRPRPSAVRPRPSAVRPCSHWIRRADPAVTGIVLYFHAARIGRADSGRADPAPPQSNNLPMSASSAMMLRRYRSRLSPFCSLM